MRAVSKDETPITIEGDGLEVRTTELGGGMTTAFMKIPGGADLRPALSGRVGDVCRCPQGGCLL
jgi:hypothetical protein